MEIALAGHSMSPFSGVDLPRDPRTWWQIHRSQVEKHGRCGFRPLYFHLEVTYHEVLVQHSLRTLNVGCGPDDWGDVRVDVDFKTQTGATSKLNLRADAHHLPFLKGLSPLVLCWHLLVHIEITPAVS